MQQPFRIGSWQVEPRQRRICNDQGCTRLEPKSMAVLCALVEAGGQPVSRDVLVEKAWAGRVVSDDAVNRQVAKLRQALGDDPRAPRYIETIPKTGFRLLADVSAETPDGSAETPSASSPRRLGLPLTAALAAVAVLAVLGLTLDGSRSTPPPQTLRQITSTPGLEIHPSPSPSGRAVVYAARAGERADFDLFVRDADGGPPVRLTDAAAHDFHPAWSPDGERIAYLQMEKDQCAIRVVPLYGGTSTRLAGCREAHRGGGLSWSADGRGLYFADRDLDGPFSLRRLELGGGVKEILPPENGTLGDTTPRVAPDGSIAFLRVRTLGVEDAHLLTPAGELRRLSFDEGKIHGLAWYRGAVVAASNRRGGLFGLWRLDVAGGVPERLAAPPGADGPGGNADGDTVAFEQWSSQVDLWSAPLDGGEPTPIVGSTRWDWWPVVSPDGRLLAWTSDRTGAAELWVADVDGAGARRLTRFEGPYTQAAVWTPTSDALVVAAPVAGQFDLFRVDVMSGDAERLTRTPEDEAAPVFAPDGRLLFRRDLPEDSVLMDESGAVVARGVRRGVFGPDGTLWFARPAEPGLWRLVGDRPERVTGALETVDWQNWWVDADGVYLIERPHPDHPRLARLDPLTGDTVVVRELPALLYKSGLSRLGDTVIYAREMRHEADIFSLGPGSAGWSVAGAW